MSAGVKPRLAAEPTRARRLAAVYTGAIAAAVTGAVLASISPALPWLVLAAGAGAYVVIARADLFVLVLIAILPWQGALRFPTHSLTIVKLVGALLAVSVLLATLMTDRRVRLTPVIGAAVLLSAVVTLSLLVNGPNGLGTTETLRYWTLTLFVFLIVQLIDSRAAFMRAIRVLAISAMVGAAWASVQFLSGSAQRASGPISDPNDFAYFLAAMLPFLAYLFATERRRRWLWGTGLLLFALGILGSSSRGAFVALALTALWAVLARRIPARVLAGTLAAVALAGLLAFAISSAKTSHNLQIRENGLSTSVNLREAYWSAAGRIAVDHPLFGVGPAQFQLVGPSYIHEAPKVETQLAVNNTYLTMLSENGLLASLAFLAFLVATWRQIALAKKDLWLRSAFQAAFVVALVGGIFFSAQLSTPFWLIAALASALSFEAYARGDERS